MAKQNQTIQHILDSPVHKATSGPPRLLHRLTPERADITYDDLLEDLRTVRDYGVTDYFIDTNIFTGPEMPQKVWAELLKGRITLTREVWSELLPWRHNPHRNQDIARELVEARRSGSGSILFNEDFLWGQPGGICREYYINLLVERKRKGKTIVDDLTQKLGRRPTEAEIHQAFQREGDDLDFHILNKGYKEIEQDKNVFTDEELVVTAVLISVMSNRGVIILTRDKDVLDEFYNLTLLMNVQYQATCFAEHFASDPAQFTCHPLPRTKEMDHYFDVDRSMLVEKPVQPDDFVSWVLPDDYKTIRIGCVLLTGQKKDDLRLTLLLWEGESAVLELVKAKAESRGLNTSLLSGKNCHVTGFPLAVQNPRSFVFIGKDRYRRAPESYCRYPLLDTAHVMTHFENMRSL